LNGAVEKAVISMKVKMYELAILHLGPSSRVWLLMTNVVLGAQASSPASFPF
jgi:hypothetical protein